MRLRMQVIKLWVSVQFMSIVAYKGAYNCYISALLVSWTKLFEFYQDFAHIIWEVCQ